MDDSPQGLIHELRTAILRKRVGQIALAVILAEAAYGFLRAITWYLLVPILAKILHRQTESVLFERAGRNPIPWDSLLGSLLELLLVVIVVLFLNRWIHRKTAAEIPAPQTPETDIVEPTESRPLA